jgi:hypothetical protein
MAGGLDVLTDGELAAFDIAAMLTAGLPGGNEVARRDLFGIGAVGAAVVLDRAGTIPRSVTYLAEIVRAGGIGVAAELAEPLPSPAQIAAIRPWLAAAARAGMSVATDDLMARWLRDVATVLAVRIADRGVAGAAPRS